MNVIDFGALNNAIKRIEDMIIEYNVEERELIIKNIAARIMKERQKCNESEVMGRAINKLPMGKMMAKLMKSQGGEPENDETS